MFLPFLPMLATQILLNNLLYDISEIGIPFDRVTEAEIVGPQKWDLRAFVRFAALMGPLSSAFDLATFALLDLVFVMSPEGFRTGWFVESIATQILVIFLIRTRGRPWRDWPHPFLAFTSLAALTLAIAAPLSPLRDWFGFTPLPGPVWLAIAGLVMLYLITAEALKGVAMRASLRAGRA